MAQRDVGETESDEDDFESDEEADKGDPSHISVTLALLKKWGKEIKKDKSNKTIVAAMEAFHAAVITIADDEEPSQYKVEGSSAFNGTIQFCVLLLGPALRRYLGILKGSKQPPHKCKKFIKIKRPLGNYLSDLSKLLSRVSLTQIQTILLKHMYYLSSFLTSYQKITKLIIKRLIVLWGTGDEDVRVLAFCCIFRATNNQRLKFLDDVLKSMFMTYVNNSKFVSVSSLGCLNFMRQSLVEMFSVDMNVAYQRVFLYIRQLAIHLRNAMKEKKKENIQAVYNWQYINSLKLWGQLLGANANKSSLQKLIFPFVQVTLGTIRLIPSKEYYPLRFHCLKILISLSRDTGAFIPILLSMLEILISYDFNEKHQKASMKPLDFTCLLRVSKSQMSESGFKDALIENIYELTLECLSLYANSIAFPDISLICVIQIKLFLKKCVNRNYVSKMKQLLQLIQQNSEFIENERAKITIDIRDSENIKRWESKIKDKGTPLMTFYGNWQKIHTIKKKEAITNNDKLSDSKLSAIKKKNHVGTKNDQNDELFRSDNSEEEEESENIKTKRRNKGKGSDSKKMKKAKKQDLLAVNSSEDEDVKIKKRKRDGIGKNKTLKKRKIDEDLVEDITDW